MLLLESLAVRITCKVRGFVTSDGAGNDFLMSIQAKVGPKKQGLAAVMPRSGRKLRHDPMVYLGVLQLSVPDASCTLEKQ